MNSFFQFRNQKTKFEQEAITKMHNTLYRDKLLTSKNFWIISIYFFLSISLLTGLHMYEYLKCNFCI